MEIAHEPLIAFPALAIARRNSFMVVLSLEPICTASHSGIQKGYYSDLHLFDTGGHIWSVAQATPVRPPSFFDRILNRRFPISLSFHPPISGGQSKAAEWLCELVDFHKHDDLYDQFVSREALKGLFRSAMSPSELIQRAEQLGAT